MSPIKWEWEWNSYRTGERFGVGTEGRYHISDLFCSQLFGIVTAINTSYNIEDYY